MLDDDSSPLCSIAHAVSLPMNEVIGNVLLGSINGTMTSGISLVPGQVGNGLHMTGNTGRVDLGFHQFECFYNPDSCSQGVTFAVWVKREHGSKDGYLLNTGATRRDSKGRWCITYTIVSTWIVCKITGHDIRIMIILLQTQSSSLNIDSKITSNVPMDVSGWVSERWKCIIIVMAQLWMKNWC